MAREDASDTWIDEWLSAGRFATYISAAGGDRGRALALYEWNAQLSAAFLHDLAISRSVCATPAIARCKRRLCPAILTGLTPRRS